MRVREIANTYARTVLFQFTWDRESVTTRLSLCHSFIIPPLTEVKRLLDTLNTSFHVPFIIWQPLLSVSQFLQQPVCLHLVLFFLIG